MRMDLAAILTIIGIGLANIGTTITLFIWSTSHATGLTQAHREETNAILKAIQDEMKDFHGRLCAIEERNRSR
jgi:hypothetical protein